MSMITRMDYERFLERYVMQDIDGIGRVLRIGLRRRVIEWRGSNPKTYKNHERKLISLGYMEDHGAYMQIAEPTLALLRQRIAENKAEIGRLAEMQRHAFTGEALPEGYGIVAKKVTLLTDLRLKAKEEARIPEIGPVIEPPQKKLIELAAERSGAIVEQSPPSDAPLNSGGTPPAPQKEAET